jgi:uncharacterized OB-fold protein
MRCKKCAYITFDFYENCPKCGSSFKEIKENLNIINYSISEECNYLIPEKIVEQKQEKLDDVKLDNVQVEKKKEKEIKKEFKIEHTKVEESQDSNIDEDGINISDLLETTKIED